MIGQTIGEIVDKRKDIWSLGVALYEMLTGKLRLRRDYDSTEVKNVDIGTSRNLSL